MLLGAALLATQLVGVLADVPQLPIQRPPHTATNPSNVGRPHRIAIIGAGAGGSSTAHHLRKFSTSPHGAEEQPLDITIFDSNPYVGGRSTTVNAFNDSRYPLELGASIFVEINQILWNASREFGLDTAGAGGKNYDESGLDVKYELGIWDGESFVFKAERDDDEDRSSWAGWWDIAKLLWRYGLAPVRTRTATRKAVGSFLKFYESPVFPFLFVQEAVDATGLGEYTGKTGTEVLKGAGVGEKFSREIIQASTRVNYASNLGAIHGLETLVCMAIEGAMAVEDGNWQIFGHMVSGSADELFLNTSVTDVGMDEDTGRFTLTTGNPWLNERLRETRRNEFDTVVLAAPYQFSEINFEPEIISPPEKIPYVDLYVTLFASPNRLSPSFFGLEDEADVPSSVLTTLSPELSDKLGQQQGQAAVGPAGFWSISMLRAINPATDGHFCGPLDDCDEARTNDARYLYKIFSPAPLTGSFLSVLLDFEHTPSSSARADSLSDLSKEHVPWLYEKHWHSYPYELPRTRFENFTMCMTEECARGGESNGIWYLNGMESFISTMETSALAGMNVARLIVDRLHEEQK